MKEFLLKKLNDKEATIGIIGLGYVGLPLSLTYAEKGFKVIGIDIDQSKINKLKNYKSYICHIDTKRIEGSLKSGKFYPTNNFSYVNKLDAIILCVPTPLNKYREPELKFINETIESIKTYLKKGQILSLESTTYPGTTEEIIRPKIENNNFTIGKDFFLVYSPEREDPGNLDYPVDTIPKVMGGISKTCTCLGKALYEQIFKNVVSVTNTKTAEMTKLLENIHRAVNIGLMNELKPLADRMGIDLYEVVRAAATKPFGFSAFYPGPGLGGHCIPIDPFYLTWKAREYGMHTRFIELAGEINDGMPKYVLDKLNDILNDRGKSIKGSNILILGITYKKNVDDMRESPAVKLMNLLNIKGAELSYSDPYIKEFPKMRHYNFDMKNITLDPKILSTFDAVVLVTDHDSFDYEMIEKFSNLVVDTRGRWTPGANIIRG